MLFDISITIYEYYDFQLSSLDVAGFVTSNPPESSSQIHSHEGGSHNPCWWDPSRKLSSKFLVVAKTNTQVWLFDLQLHAATKWPNVQSEARHVRKDDSPMRDCQSPHDLILS